MLRLKEPAATMLALHEKTKAYTIEALMGATHFSDDTIRTLTAGRSVTPQSMVKLAGLLGVEELSDIAEVTYNEPKSN